MNHFRSPRSLISWGQSLMKFWAAKKTDAESYTMLPVLCRFWQEDGVWNAEAAHLAVAVFGSTFEEAQRNLQSAIVSHMECWVEAGRADQIVEQLRAQSHEQLKVEDISPDSPLVKIQIGMQDDHVIALSALA